MKFVARRSSLTKLKFHCIRHGCASDSGELRIKFPSIFILAVTQQVDARISKRHQSTKWINTNKKESLQPRIFDGNECTRVFRLSTTVILIGKINTTRSNLIDRQPVTTASVRVYLFTINHWKGIATPNRIKIEYQVYT